ncbi:unnamed protein product [Calicophoron daubneyi]|uniref:Uncharacterized protein n=1 Tax=Calicophoron daubneyi TaxID=300641 RepID=A0AAV2TPD0_CALDB
MASNDSGGKLTDCKILADAQVNEEGPGGTAVVKSESDFVLRSPNSDEETSNPTEAERSVSLSSPQETPLLGLFFKFRPCSIAKYLQDRRLLPSRRACVCGHVMRVQELTRSNDGCVLRCTRCKAKASIRNGTFFSKSRLSLTQITQLCFLFVMETPVSLAAALTGVSFSLAAQWYSSCQEVCAAKLLHLSGQANECDIVRLGQSLVTQLKSNLSAERWSAVAERLENMCGSHPVQYWAPLIELQYRMENRFSNYTVFKNFETFLTHVSEIYPV